MCDEEVFGSFLSTSSKLCLLTLLIDDTDVSFISFIVPPVSWFKFDALPAVYIWLEVFKNWKRDPPDAIEVSYWDGGC